MANWMEWPDEKEQLWQEWLKNKPPIIKELAARFPPYKLFRLKPTGQRGPIVSLSESGTVTMQITGDFNRVMFAKNVFGLNPDDLEECDLPGPDELLGDECEERGIDPENVIPMIRSQMILDGHLPIPPRKPND